ncbi:hypothetical protein E4U47_003293 [Claviceps purpurea]|nr:hypothetical protein E4U36_004774 [Claviceps purpurea]KAG6279477.1 hypothetical protein E4U47_003293 [Claviceps purpurea]
MSETTFNFPSCEETMQHPAYNSAAWGLEPHSSGKFAVAKGRGGPLNLYWEIHGQGPTKIVLIMGLGAILTTWQIQTHYFGHLHGDKYTVLVFDNRGIGRSDAPIFRYSTSAMALDTIELLDHLGWTSPRQLNIAGLSLGGMIAQEIACLIPQRIQSLSLLCTTAYAESGRSLSQSVLLHLKRFRPKSEDQSIHDTARTVFPLEFLTAKDDTIALPSPRTTPKCRPADTPDGEYPHFDSHFQRFQAQELHKRHGKVGTFTRSGFFCQLSAAAGHSKSAAQLAKMADEVGRERILVMHGARDDTLVVRNGERLIREVKPGVGIIVEGMGHAPIMERSAWFNEFLEERLGAWGKL